MKKTLVALAVLAASGASFAQVTITGGYGFAYQQKPYNGTANAVRGLQTTDGGLTFTATEDMGGGMKAKAVLNYDVQGRNGAFGATDAMLQLTTGFGLITMGSVESGNWTVNAAGAPISLDSGFDGWIQKPAANVDNLSLSIPMGSFGVTVGYTDGQGDNTDFANRSSAGAGSSAVQTASVTGSYSDGPIMARVQFTSYMSTNALADGQTRIRAIASYDLGVAKLGLGLLSVEQTKALNNLQGADGIEYNLSASVPMGAVTLGAMYGSAADNGNTALGTAGVKGSTGWAFGADYALSKMTALNVSYAMKTESGVADSNQYRIRVMKSF